MIHRLLRHLPRSTRHRLVPLVPEGTRHPHTGGWAQAEGQWTVLLFSASLADPMALPHLQAASDLRPAFEARGCQLVVIAPDKPPPQLYLPLCSGPAPQVAARFGAVLRLPGLAPRVADAALLLDPDGVVRLANRGRPSLEAILRSVVALQEA